MTPIHLQGQMEHRFLVSWIHYWQYRTNEVIHPSWSANLVCLFSDVKIVIELLRQQNRQILFSILKIHTHVQTAFL